VLALRMCNTNREAEYTKSQQAWQHDKDNLTHKSRQEEKVFIKVQYIPSIIGSYYRSEMPRLNHCNKSLTAA